MFCCDTMGQIMERNIIVMEELSRIRDGRIITDVDTEYFIRSEEGNGRISYVGMNYCPFCGRAISRGLWAAEKKK
jgi:hypothetical protein